VVANCFAFVEGDSNSREKLFKAATDLLVTEVVCGVGGSVSYSRI